MNNKFLAAVLLLLFVGAAAAAEPIAVNPPTPADVVVLANDGNVDFDDFGPWYVDDERRWEKWFAAQDQFPFLCGHNFFGHNPAHSGKMMKLDALSRMIAYAKAHPDPKFRARADRKAFIRGAKARTSQGLWLGAYMGGFNQDAFPFDLKASAKTNQMMVLDEISWLWEGGFHFVCFDAENGPSCADPAKWTEFDKLIYGPNGVARLVIQVLQRKGIEVAIEPYPFEDYKPYHGLANMLQDVQFISREYPTKAARDAIGRSGLGASGWNTNSHKARPIRRPDPSLIRVYRKIDTLNETKANKLRHVEMAREVDHIPCVPIIQYMPEMETAA